MEKVRINNGRAVHMAEKSITGKGYYTSCGTARIQNARATVYRPALASEEVTCKKCLALMEKEDQFKKDAEIMKKNFTKQHHIAEELKRMKENRESFYLAK